MKILYQIALRKSVLNLVIVLDSFPGGGSFQYDQTILKAVFSLPSDRYKITVLYANDIWAKYLGKTIRKQKTPFHAGYERFLQFMIMSGIPINLLRSIAGFLDSSVKMIEFYRPDLTVFSSQNAFRGYLVKGATLLTIHDLMHRYEKRFPEASGNGRSRYREHHFAAICKYATGILADSDVGKQQIISSYSVSPGKIHVLPYTAPPYIREKENSTNHDSHFDLPPKYLFYPAQFWQHKNHDKLLRALDLVRKEIPDIKLVLVGSQKNSYKSVVRLAKKLLLDDIVIFRQYIPDYDMPEYYRRARALIMPTYFGPTNIPPLEAFAVGCPVAISKIYGIPDQVGDAALLFNPESIQEIAAAIKALWTDDALCLELVRRGKIMDARLSMDAFTHNFGNIIGKLSISLHPQNHT